jgi:hypothetical protein
MFYSAKTNGFYVQGIHDAMPSDVVEISDSYHSELLDGQSKGKVIAPDNKGYPRLIDPPPPSPEEMQRRKNVDARAYLLETDWYVVRFAETGASIPDDVRAARESARASIVE